MKDGGPAFPHMRDEHILLASAVCGKCGAPAIELQRHYGMSLRDYFAGQALMGFANNENVANYLDHGKARVAELAYQLADAMLKARET